MISLDDKVRAKLAVILERQLPGARVLLVGSRARVTAKRYADIDRLMVSPGSLTREARAFLNAAFDESDIPCKVDIMESDALSDSFRKRLLQDAEPL